MSYSGHVRKRNTKNSQLTYQVIIEEPSDRETGKRNRIYRTVHGTKKDAERVMREMIADLENKTYIKPITVTVKSWINEFYSTYQEPYLSESTLNGYRYQIDTYIIPALGKIAIQELSPLQIQQWINELKEESPVSHEPLSAKTVKNIHLNLSAALSQAVKLDMIKKNPCDNVILPKAQKAKLEIYTEDEVEKITKSAKGTDMELIIMLALGLGLRRGEMIALRWENVDLDNGVVHIRENRVDGRNGKVVTKLPKSDAGVRDIPLSASMIALLKRERIKFFKKQLEYGIGRKNDDYVVCQDNGNPYKPFSISKKWRKFTENNNIRHVKLHGLRHTNASLLLSQGVSPKVVQQRLGHSDFSITMNIYAHVMKTMETEAADKLEAVLFQGIA